MRIDKPGEMDTNEAAANFDSSDEEAGEFDLTPLNISWLDLTQYGYDVPFGITSLPGCRFKDVWRSLENDIKCLVTEGVEDVFCLCSKGELNRYRVQNLLPELSKANINVHHYPFPDGQPPEISLLMKMMEEIKDRLANKKRAIIHCYGGLGRSCVVGACLLMMLDPELQPEQAIQKMKDLRGARAVQTIKQFNYISDFREILSDFKRESEGTELKRSLSR